MPGDGPEVLFLAAVFLSSSGLQFFGTEFCTGLECVIEYAVLSHKSASLFKSLKLVYRP